MSAILQQMLFSLRLRQLEDIQMTKDIFDEECATLSDEECREIVGGIMITPFNFPGKGTFYDGVEMQLDYRNSTEGIWDTATQRTYA